MSETHLFYRVSTLKAYIRQRSRAIASFNSVVIQVGSQKDVVAMARATSTRTPSRIERRLREGRGQGEGADYQPYLTIRDVPSKGRSHRDMHLSGGRTMHFLSDLEYRFAIIADWQLPLYDLREQYPLPLEETQAIAERYGYRHPRHPRTKDDEPLTTDIVLTLRTSDEHYDLACSIKESVELGSARNLEKLEIERQWWIQRGCLWVLVTDREIPPTFAENIHYLNAYRTISDRVALTKQELTTVIGKLTEMIEYRDLALSRVCSICDAALGLEPGASLAIAYHLLATRRWHTDLREALDASRPLTLLATPLPSPVGFHGENAH